MQNTALARDLSFSLIDGYKTCKVVTTEHGTDYIIDGSGISKTEDVDMFFPGAVLQLPDYIK